MADDTDKPGIEDRDEESIETLTDLIDRLEQKSFLRSLDRRHPVDDIGQSFAEAESS